MSHMTDQDMNLEKRGGKKVINQIQLCQFANEVTSSVAPLKLLKRLLSEMMMLNPSASTEDVITTRYNYLWHNM